MTTRKPLNEIFKELRAAATGPTVEPNSQDWADLGGAAAFHLIERHADNWADAELMMDEFAASRILAERERCALLAESLQYAELRTPVNVAEAIRKGTP